MAEKNTKNTAGDVYGTAIQAGTVNGDIHSGSRINVGVNHGLNRRTPANQVYLGLAKRF